MTHSFTTSGTHRVIKPLLPWTPAAPAREVAPAVEAETSEQARQAVEAALRALVLRPGVARRRINGTLRPRVSVVMPTLNEAANLPFVRDRLSAVDELIVVDGHSSDDTVAVARRLWPWARVIRQPGRGKGDALRAGFAAARGDIIVMLDADGSTDPREIPLFVRALVNGADFAKGSRFAHGGGSADITPVRRIGARALAGLVNLFFRTGYTDLCYGYNAFWRDCLDDLSITSCGFEIETQINISVARADLAVTEVPSVEGLRLHGDSHLHTIRDGLRVLRTIVRERLRRRTRSDSANWSLAGRPRGIAAERGSGRSRTSTIVRPTATASIAASRETAARL